jgi:AbrB family looped-hinge helix DNA binding protein
VALDRSGRLPAIDPFFEECVRPPARRGAAQVYGGPRGETTKGVVIALWSVPYYTDNSKEKERAMTTDATLTSKGQTTIPKEIRDSLGLQPGDRMTFTLMPDGTVVMRVKTKSVMELAGLLRKKGRKPVAIERLSR